MKKALAILLTLVMIVGLMAGCGSTSTGEEPAAESKDIKIALITMDSIDQHWITLNEGAQKAAAEEYGDRLVVAKVNIDEEAQLAEAEGVEVIPTLILYKNGAAADFVVNPGSKAAMDQFIQEALEK